jgi:hypothetical protein
VGFGIRVAGGAFGVVRVDLALAFVAFGTDAGCARMVGRQDITGVCLIGRDQLRRKRQTTTDGKTEQRVSEFHDRILMVIK